MFFTKIKIFVFLSLFIVNLSLASNYYADPVNGNISNDGSSLNPWSTLQEVLSTKTFAGGDTLFLRTGFHGANFYIGGNYTTNFVIKADDGSSPALLKVLLGGKKVVLDNLVFTAVGNRGYEVSTSFDNGFLLAFTTDAENSTVQNCSFFSGVNCNTWTVQNWRDSVWSGVKDYGVNNTIKDNHLKNIAYALTAMQQSNSTLFENNLVEQFSGDGIRCAGATSTVIQYNTIRNALELDADNLVGNHEDGIQGWGTIVGLEVRGNHVYSDSATDTIPFIGPIQGIVIFDGTTTNSLFENNIVVTEHWHGITVLGSYNSKYINNTVLPVPNKLATQGPPWIKIDKTKEGVSSSGNIVRNNLTTDLDIEVGSSTADHNVESLTAHNFLNDYNNWDFSPLNGYNDSGVEIIDAGSSVDAPTLDINKLVRPQGCGYDIGAEEYEVPVPVELLYFVATTDENNITFSWETATEINNYGFEIELYSPKDESKIIEWEVVAFVEGHGNSNTPNVYNLSIPKRAGNYRLKQIDVNGSYEYSDEIKIDTDSNYKLYQNHPNPFNPTTIISFSLPKASYTTLTIYNEIGQKVTELLNKKINAGSYQINFNASFLSSGVYYYRIVADSYGKAGSFVESKKMILVK